MLCSCSFSFTKFYMVSNSQGKFKEALAVANTGLKLPQLNKGDEYVASHLRRFMLEVENKAKDNGAPASDKAA